MDAQERDNAICELLMPLAENFGKVISPALSAMILTVLEPYPLGQIEAGVMRLIRERRYASFPTVAEILDAMGAGEEQALALQAEQQWLALLESSSYETPPLDAAGVMAFRCMGGEKYSWTNANLDWKRKAFIEGYLKFAKAEQAGLLMLDGPRNPRLKALAGRAVKEIV